MRRAAASARFARLGSPHSGWSGLHQSPLKRKQRFGVLAASLTTVVPPDGALSLERRSLVAPAPDAKRARKGDTVEISYRLIDMDTRKVVEDSKRGGDAFNLLFPDVFRLGEGRLPPGLEHQIEGRGEGEVFETPLYPEDAFGAFDPNQAIQYQRLMFDSTKLTKGDTVLVNENERAHIREADRDFFTLDRNHPLAGKAFEALVQIHKVTPPEDVREADGAFKELAVQTMEPGDGKTFPKKTSRVTVDYVGRARDTGRVLYSTYGEDGKLKGPLTFFVGCRQVFPGLDEAVMRMSLGEKARVVIPASMVTLPKPDVQLAPGVPRSTDLVFEIKLLNVETAMEDRIRIDYMGCGDNKTFPLVGYRVLIHYRMFAKDQMVDSSYSNRTPVTFRVGFGEVITGLDLALPKISLFESAHVHIPADFAHGSRGVGFRVHPVTKEKMDLYLPPDADIVVVVDMLKIYNENEFVPKEGALVYIE